MGKDFSKYSDEQLREELERRSSTPPSLLEVVQFNALQKRCEEYIEYLSGLDVFDADEYKYEIYAAALEAFYGKEVWKFVNKRLK